MSIPSISSIESIPSIASMPSDLRSFIIRHEGLRLTSYKCSRGFWTWGCGCRITDPMICEALDAGIVFELTRPQAESLLTRALSRATRDAIALFPSLNTYSPPRQTAIISLSFQLGKEGLAGFRLMRRAILLGDWTRAADELRYYDGLLKMQKSAYATQCPARCQETALMLETGEWQPAG